MGIQVKAILGEEKFYTEVFAGNNKLVTDEPFDKGGQNKGFDPHEILATSLASCTAATLKMYIDRKEWNVGNIIVEVNLEKFPETNSATFTRTISFSSFHPDEEQLKKILLIAEKCPVHKTLTGNIQINTKINADA
jgi:putative redox protein